MALTVAPQKLVRPFQNEPVFRKGLAAPNPDFVRPDSGLPKIEIAGSADSKYTEAPPPATLSFTVEWKEDKSRRTTDQVRVENPSDSSQFVEVERIKAATFKNTKTGQEMKLNLDWSN